MKTVIFLLLIAFGYMWYRGDFDTQLKQLELPDSSIAKTKPAKKEVKINDVIAKDKAVKPVGLEVFEKEKSSFVAQQKWLESHRVKDEERLVIDKLHNWASTGRYE